GTGPGLALALAWVRQRDPHAIVIESPSDHFIPRARPFLDGLRVALEGADDGRLVLLGVKAEWAETGYGWIVPGVPLRRRVNAVQGFVEKPDSSRAEELLHAGALWNTFVFAVRLDRLWGLAEHHLPDQCATLERYFTLDPEAGEAAHLASLYTTMRPGDFS